MIQHWLNQINGGLEYVLIVLLLGTGLWLTLRLGFIQFRRFWYGIEVVRGKHDDPSATGDVSHFQALTTALSATVGIGNIAGVAIAIHWGGPGAIFWMWVTAVLGMATKFTEVTLAQHFRVSLPGAKKGAGSVAGGPMYYIEKGLGPRWKPMAFFFAGALVVMALVSGNAVQANTLADLLESMYAVPTWMTGLVTATLVGVVLMGGIGRIGRVTGILAPIMAGLYILGGLLVVGQHLDQVLPALNTIVREAFNPTAGIAGAGAGVFLQTLIWGVRRGLFSNEAGQGSAPIAHAAAKTDEPVTEGVVALLEPFIDTIVICTITALVILTTGVWKETTPTALTLSGGDSSYRTSVEAGNQAALAPDTLIVFDGSPYGEVTLAWHELPVERLYVDADQQQPFSGIILPSRGEAIERSGKVHQTLYGAAVENAAPLTLWAYESTLGVWGGWIVLLCVALFAVSTAISWSYYGDRCVGYLFGQRAIPMYRVVYVGMHFVGAILSLNVVWSLGDLAMALGTIPNVIALLFLSGLVVKLTRSYFSKE